MNWRRRGPRSRPSVFGRPMKLDAAFSRESLAALGEDAVAPLFRGEISALAERYGYALACGRGSEPAIRADLARSLSDVGARSLGAPPAQSVRAVKYFKPNSSNLVALVECLAPTDNGADLLVELIVTANGEGHHITLEEISNAA